MKYKINKIIVMSIVSIFALAGLSVGFATLNDEINNEDRNLDWGWVQLINVEDNSCPPPYYPTSDPDYGCDPEYGFFEISDNLGWGPLPLDKNVGWGILTQIDEDILELTVNNVYPGYWNGITTHVHYIKVVPITIQEATLSWNSDGTDIIAVINDENEGEIIHIDLDGDGTTDMEFMDKNDFNHQLGYDDKQEYSWDFCFLQTLPQSSTFTFYITLRATRSGGGAPPPPSYYSPTADPNGPYYGFIGEEIEFDGTSSHDNDENGKSIERYDWKFFDEDVWHKDLGANPTHTYNDAGDYTVTLKVTDDEGKTDTDTATVYIIKPNNPPTIITAEGPTTGDTNTTYTYTVNSTDDNSDDTIIYTFNWGDGTNTASDVLASNTSFNAIHNWSTYGFYTVTITAEDRLGAQDVETITVYIDVLPIDGEIKGYLVDKDSDDTYDSFDDNKTGEQIDIDQDNSTYLIDNDGDGKYDYTYNTEKGLLTYYEYVYQKYYPKIQGTHGFEVISLLSMIVLVFVIIKRRKK